MGNRIQLILATAGLSILIWVYADQQGWRVVKIPDVAVTVTTLPDVVPRILEAGPEDSPTTIHVRVEARGPNAAIRELNLTRPPALEVSVPVTENITTDRPRVIDLKDPIALALRERGLQLLSVTPPSMAVSFDRKVSFKIEPQADAGSFAQALDGKIEIEPQTVTATVLNSEVQNVPSPVETRIIIPIEDELRSHPGQSEFDIPLSLKTRTWQNLDVTWNPDTIRMKGKFRRVYEDLELKLIPVRVLLPLNWPGDDYDVVFVDERDRLQKIEVKVPLGKPTLLTNKDVTAYITVDEGMIPAASNGNATNTATQPAAEPSPFTQDVRFVLPDEFNDVKIVSPPATVKFRIVPRSAAAEAQPITP